MKISSSELKISDRIKEMRNRFGMTQVQFSELIGIKTKTYASYESNTFPNNDVLIAIANQGVNLHWLISGQGEMMVDNSQFTQEALDSYEMIRVLDTFNRLVWDESIDPVAKLLFFNSFKDRFDLWNNDRLRKDKLKKSLKSE
ncbi:MAG: helix-turn-helix transcriptional regulator [Bacteroidetes bacterium]|nr:helix-turn-helix transcriptional regulator [Bacteroidota bacterium]